MTDYRLKKKINRMAAVLLSFMLVFSNTLILHADEVPEEPQAEEVVEEAGGTQDPAAENPQAEEPQEQPEEQPEEKPEEQPAEQPEEKPEEKPSEQPEEKQEEQPAEQPEEKPEEEKPEEKEEEKPAEKVSKITVNNSTLSFGTILESEKPRPLSFIITNEGETEVSLGWSQTDVNGVFMLNMPDSVNIPLAPGKGIQGSVETVEKGITPGDYSTTLIFSDLNNSGVQAKIDVSLRVERSKPVITKVKIKPSSADVRQGGRADFEVVVEGENDPDLSVTWKTKGQTSKDTYISNDGSLYIGSDETASEITVIAESNQNDSCKDAVSARVIKDKYIVKTYVEPSDGGYINGKGSFSGGERTTLTAVAENGYEFVEWRKTDGTFVTGSPSFTTDPITKDLEYKAIFVQSGYEIRVKSSDEHMGTVKGGGYIESGESVTIEAKPKDGYFFKGWYEKDKLVSKEAKLKIKNIKKSHTFTAEFGKEKYLVNLSPSPSEGGKVSGGGTYKKGDDVTLKAAPENGYHFKGFILNNELLSTSQEYTIKNLDRDLSVTANFEKDGVKVHSITSGVANKGGVISPSGELSVAEGTTVTYAIAADDGYGVLMVSVDGTQVGAVTSWTFLNVKEDHTISVAFAPKENSVNEVKMDKIISTEEADEMAVARLKEADEGSEESVSEIITPEQYAAMTEEEKAGDCAEIVIPKEQNLIGMDNTEGLPNTVGGYNPDTETGVYQALDITRETAEKLIDAKGDSILINQAYEMGYLDILINNEYLVPGKEGDILDIENDNTVKNLQEVIRACLTKEEKLSLYEGKDVLISFTISGAENPGEYEKESMKGAKGVSIDEYLYITLIKTVDGVPVVVETLDTPVRLTLSIPESLRDSSKSFCIVRNHNGEVDVLNDMDNDPDTITIETDRFSPYAIGHLSKDNSTFALILICAGFGLTVLILGTYITLKGKH